MLTCADTKIYLNKYVQQNLRKSKGKFYCCPACGSGTHGTRDSDGALSIKSDGIKWKCFSCGRGGDLIDLIKIVENLDTKEARKRAIEFSGYSFKEVKNCYRKSEELPKKKQVEIKSEPQIDFTKFIEVCKENINKTDYPQKRGFSEETIRRYRLGYYDGKGKAKEIITKLIGRDIIAPSLVIPYNMNFTYFIARSTIETDVERAEIAAKGIGKPNYQGKQKHDKPPTEKAGREPIYNPTALYNKEGKPVFITEAPLDCLSYLEVGKQAIAIGGTGHEKLIERLKKQPTKNALIIALDDDEAGQKAAKILKGSLESLGYNPYMKNNL